MLLSSWLPERARGRAAARRRGGAKSRRREGREGGSNIMDSPAPLQLHHRERGERLDCYACGQSVPDGGCKTLALLGRFLGLLGALRPIWTRPRNSECVRVRLLAKRRAGGRGRALHGEEEGESAMNCRRLLRRRRRPSRPLSVWPRTCTQFRYRPGKNVGRGRISALRRLCRCLLTVSCATSPRRGRRSLSRSL